MIGSFDSKLSVLESAKPILAELLCWDIVREAVCAPARARGESLAVGALSWSVIYRGAALGRGFEELSVGERGQRHQIITQQVLSIISFVRAHAVTAGKLGFINRQTHIETSLFFIPPHIFLSRRFFLTHSHTHITKETNTVSPETQEGPPCYNTAWYSFCWKFEWLSYFLKTTLPSSLISPRIPFAVYTF